MNFVVYVDTPIPRSGDVVRLYVQSNVFNNAPTLVELCKLDALPIEFPTRKEAEKFANTLAANYSDYMGMYTIGYHGITENGNACRPFCTVYRGKNRVTANLQGAYNNLCKMEAAYEQFHLPSVARIANSHVERGYTLTRGQLLGELDQLLANMVDEEFVSVLTKIESLEHNNFICTDVDMYETSAVVHYENIDVFPTRKVTLTITALNMYDEAAIKELGSLNERLLAEGVSA